VTPSAPTMTVGRQLLAALAVPIFILLIVAALGVVALDRVGDAKDDVIDGEAQKVIEALRLDFAVSERGVLVRNLLITGNTEYESRMEQAEETFERAFSRLSGLVEDVDERTMLEEIRDRKDELDARISDAIARRLAGDLAPEDLASVINDELTPARQALTEVVDAFVEAEEQAIDRSVEESDDTARNTTWLLLALVAAGVLLAVGIGGWITRNVNRRLTGFALNIDAAASQILAGTTEQAAAAAQQAAAVQQTVATADELAQTADQSAERARAVADAAQRSTDVAHDGSTAVSESADAMAQIRQQVDVIATTVVSLAERAQDISGIVRAVDDLSEQIHLLALNAAIEAARAGEHGKGFAVVATEIRALADQSKRATNDIAGILGEIQQGTNTAVMATEEGGKSVTLGVDRVERAGATIEELASTVADSALAAEQISASSGQQAVATSQISHAMRDMDDTAQQNAAAARQAEQAARDLNQVAANLKALVGVR
jgi:methyl-accepting chemotaxis protein